jgi:hypothetical protein
MELIDSYNNQRLARLKNVRSGNTLYYIRISGCDNKVEELIPFVVSTIRPCVSGSCPNDCYTDGVYVTDVHGDKMCKLRLFNHNKVRYT